MYTFRCTHSATLAVNGKYVYRSDASTPRIGRQWNDMIGVAPPVCPNNFAMIHQAAAAMPRLAVSLAGLDGDEGAGHGGQAPGAQQHQDAGTAVLAVQQRQQDEGVPAGGSRSPVCHRAKLAAGQPGAACMENFNIQMG